METIQTRFCTIQRQQWKLNRRKYQQDKEISKKSSHNYRIYWKITSCFIPNFFFLITQQMEFINIHFVTVAITSKILNLNSRTLNIFFILLYLITYLKWVCCPSWNNWEDKSNIFECGVAARWDGTIYLWENEARWYDRFRSSSLAISDLVWQKHSSIEIQSTLSQKWKIYST